MCWFPLSSFSKTQYLLGVLLSVDLNAETPLIDLSLTKTLCGSSAVGAYYLAPLSRNIISIIAILSQVS